MPSDFIAACLQMTSGDDIADNLRRAGLLIAAAANDGARLLALPEFFPLMSADETAKLAIAERDNDGPAQNFLADMARWHGVYLVGGTLPIAAPDGGGKALARCPLYAPNGDRVAYYDKAHLFRFAGESRTYDESATMSPGGEVVAADTPLGRIGLAVCYDLRFPELFRRMGGADIIVAPSAFTPETGRAHWELLLRARAVENLAHVLGAAQSGEHPGGRKTHGETMIVGPWGETLARAEKGGDCHVLATIDGEERAALRRRLPALDHRRFF